MLLGAGGLGLGIQFSALIRHLTTAVPAEYAADISGVSTTALQIGAATGVAAFGTLYLSLTSRGGAEPATHAFAFTTAAFAVVALLATATAALATRQAPHQRNPVTGSRRRTRPAAGSVVPHHRVARTDDVMGGDLDRAEAKRTPPSRKTAA